MANVADEKRKKRVEYLRAVFALDAARKCVSVAVNGHNQQRLCEAVDDLLNILLEPLMNGEPQ